MTNEALIKEAIKLKKPIILSTGLAFKSEIKRIVSIFKKNPKRVILQFLDVLRCTHVRKSFLI